MKPEGKIQYMLSQKNPVRISDNCLYKSFRKIKINKTHECVGAKFAPPPSFLEGRIS